jgi:hypothetical protein
LKLTQSAGVRRAVANDIMALDPNAKKILDMLAAAGMTSFSGAGAIPSSGTDGR